MHSKACPEAMRLKAMHGDDIVAVEWGAHIHSNFGVTLEVEGANIDGFVYMLAAALRSLRVPLMGIHFTSSKERALGQIKIRIANRDELRYVVSRLREDNDLIRIYVVAPYELGRNQYGL